MASTTDDGFHEIQLNGKQLVFLFMAVTVVSVVIFLCGVLVGRGVRIDDGASTVLEAQAAPPVPPAISATGSGAPASANEDLTYPKRLAGNEQPKEQLKPAGSSPAPAPPPAAAPASPAPNAATPPAATSAPVATTAAAKPAPAPAPAAAPAPSEPAGNGFAIQLAALRQREEADTIARRLVSKGYPAYVLNPESGAPAVFRVRVGKFKDRREADSVAARLRKEEQFNPWIVR
jgi:DedD protein